MAKQPEWYSWGQERLHQVEFDAILFYTPTGYHRPCSTHHMDEATKLASYSPFAPAGL